MWLIFYYPPRGTMDLSLKCDRSWFIDKILETWDKHVDPICMPYHKNAEGDKDTKLASKHSYLLMLSTEFLIREQKLISTLKVLITRRDLDRPDFLQCFTSNRLALRRIFAMKQPSLSNMLMALILDIASTMKTNSFMPFTSSSKFGFSQKAPLVSFPKHLVPLVTTIQFWKRDHFRFAAENGISELLADLYWQSKNRKKRENKLMATTYAHICCLYFGNAQKQQKRERNQHTNGTDLVRYLRKSLTDIIPNIEFPEFPLRLHRKMRTVFNSISADSKCGWPPCQKWTNRHSFPRKCICEGCGLVRYCSRKHQKHHWKYMHSQQCKPLRKL